MQLLLFYSFYALPICFAKYSFPIISELVTADEMTVPKQPCMFRLCPVSSRLLTLVLAGISVTIGLRQSFTSPYAHPSDVAV